MTLRTRTIGLLVILAFGASGCATVRETMKAEVGGNGGAVGHLADKGFPAPSKRLQLYRATLAFALVARTGAELLKDQEEIEAFGDYLELTHRDIQRLRRHLDQPDCYADQDAIMRNRGYCGHLFEQELPSLESNLLRAASLAFPRGDVKKIWTDMTGSAWGSAALSIIRVASQAAFAAHSDAALYRSHREIFAAAYSSALAPPGAKGQEKPSPADEAAWRRAMTASEASRALDESRMRKADFRARNFGQGDTPFVLLYRTIQDSCLRLMARVPGDPDKVKDTIACDYRYDDRWLDANKDRFLPDDAGSRTGDSAPGEPPP